MSDERRRYRRIAGPFEGSWDGLTGKRDCRITELGAGGCFIDTFSHQERGTGVVVSVLVAGQLFTLPGNILYTDPVQGFGVQFAEGEARDRLEAALAAL